MRSLHMDYHYQAKQNAVASCNPLAIEIEQKVVRPLQEQEAADYTSTVMVNDNNGNHLATGTVTWQVKEWGKVRTKR